MKESKILSADTICFGLDRKTDEQAITTFLQRFARPDLLAVLVPKLADSDIQELLECISTIMAKHLSEGQYHKFFLTDP